MKRFAVLFLAIFFTVLLLSFSAAAAATGTCGENLTWVVSDDNTLTISGTGAMDDYGPVMIAAPWVNDDTLYNLTTVVMEEGITRIGDFAFYCHRALVSVVVPASVTSIGDYVFDGSGNLETVYFCGDAPQIDCSLFGGLTATAYYPAGNPTWTEEFMTQCGENVTWLPSEPDSTPEEIPGDLDGDGEITDTDVAQLLWYTLFPDDNPIWENCDYNGDGLTNDADVAHLLWHTLFPEVYPL